ncbi:MAG: Gfo/Idh/MocA family oxidoreductase [Candidatus Omnitrophota bacterium]
MKIYNLGMVGLSPGNGHPYSWSAIFNGYNKKEMAKCPFPVIPEYLAKEDPPTMCIEEGKVTHIWTQNPEMSKQVARSSLVEHVVEKITDLIGKVDAVLLARDDGENHLQMARPFIEAGVPIFIDKPLTDQAADLKEFVRYYREGRPVMSCSSARYSRGILELKKKNDLGRILTANAVTPKYWRTYGIHMIESVCAVMGTGIESVQNVGQPGEEIVHLKYLDGRHAVIQTFAKITQGGTSFYGEKGAAVVIDPDAFFQFKNMLQHFVEMLKTGTPPFDWQETVEMSRIVIAGQKSLEEGGRKVPLKEVET